MFEIIGMLFVGFIVWSIFRGIFKGAVKGHMMRSVDYAVSQGVPRDFALKMIPNNDIMNESLKLMKEQIPELREMDVYVQYGSALKMLYEGYLSENQN